MPTRTEAVAAFLQKLTHPDLANLYNAGMECQVNVAQDGGERVEKEFRGRKWHGWSDGLTTWKSFRIPRNANTTPEYEDVKMSFDLEVHTEAIGMTGWDWKNRCSRWVAFDFDAIVGHSEAHEKKLTDEQLEDVKKATVGIDWVTIRKSTSGRGLHLYVTLDAVPTANHNEHAALARSILGKMSALAGYDFVSQVDACGGNMWVWHRKMKDTDGLEIIKQGGTLKEIPMNWRDHVKVVTGKRRKNLPQDIESGGQGDIFEELTGQRPTVELDEGHKTLINWLKENEATWWWDQDHHMLVTHTFYMQQAHSALGLRGFFATNSKGGDLHEQNCFCFPLRRGAWAIRRFSIGCQEHESWDQDGGGWTRAFFNQIPDLKTACRAFGGLEDPSGGFVFSDGDSAMKASEILGVQLNIGAAQSGRETKIKQHKDGRVIAEIEHKATDDGGHMKGWLMKGKKWTKMFQGNINKSNESEMGNYDDLVRHLVTESEEDYGWMLRSDGAWRTEPLTHIRSALGSLGFNSKEVTDIVGGSIFKAWKVVNKPFQPEYPGNREWNRNAAQFKFVPTTDSENLHYPSWKSVLEHCGSGLDDAVKDNAWCKANGIQSGGDYFKCWIASLFQKPQEPLPYLFMHGPQNSGKSIFHEALSLLLTKGYKRADAALISQAGFNAELEGSIICVVEETDLRKDRTAYNRIKDWVTSRELNIHCKGKTPYHIPNTTHWIQCANDHQACPVFTGDTRITMCYVEPLDPLALIPKRDLIDLLEKEAPDFLAEILALEIPPSNDRLNVPVLETEDKIMVSQLNQTDLERFLNEKTQQVNGRRIKFGDFVTKFHEFLDMGELDKWSKIRIGREIPPQYPKGKDHSTGQMYVGNICWIGLEPTEEKTNKLVIRNGYLEPLDD